MPQHVLIKKWITKITQYKNNQCIPLTDFNYIIYGLINVNYGYVTILHRKVVGCMILYLPHINIQK